MVRRSCSVVLKIVGVLLGIRQKRWLTIDLPFVDAIHRTGHAQVRKAPTIFNTTEQERRTIWQKCRAGVEHAVDRIGPILSRQNGIGSMPVKERFMFFRTCFYDQFWRTHSIDLS